MTFFLKKLANSLDMIFAPVEQKLLLGQFLDEEFYILHLFQMESYSTNFDIMVFRVYPFKIYFSFSSEKHENLAQGCLMVKAK